MLPNAQKQSLWELFKVREPQRPQHSSTESLLMKLIEEISLGGKKNMKREWRE